METETHQPESTEMSAGHLFSRGISGIGWTMKLPINDLGDLMETQL